MRTTINKAVGGFAAALVFAVGTALLDGELTVAEALTSLGGALITGATVWKLKYQVPVS